MSKSSTRRTLQQQGLAPKKRFGQNFLVHERTAEAIVQCGDISKNDTVVEVGVGLGAMTTPLARKAGKVLGIEIDSGIIRFHRENHNLPENVTLIHDDILRCDFASLAKQCHEPLKIMANLPYSISNPFIFKLVENREYVDWVVVMLQKEVAERLTAAPSTKEYGIPTVLLGSCATVTKLMRLSPEEFHPRPKIESLVIRIDFSTSAVSEKTSSFSGKLFQRVVRAAFAQRRKTLENNIANGEFFGFQEKKQNKEAATRAILQAGLTPGIRAENLSIAEFIHLSAAIEHHIGND